MRRRWILGGLLAALILCPPPVYADSTAYLFRGLARTLATAFEIPKTVLGMTASSLSPVGLVEGVLSGTMKTVGGLLGASQDLVRGAAPYAKYAVFL
jgi:hypothetical protein